VGLGGGGGPEIGQGWPACGSSCPSAVIWTIWPGSFRCTTRERSPDSSHTVNLPRRHTRSNFRPNRSSSVNPGHALRSLGLMTSTLWIVRPTIPGPRSRTSASSSGSSACVPIVRDVLAGTCRALTAGQVGVYCPSHAYKQPASGEAALDTTGTSAQLDGAGDDDHEASSS